MVYSLTKEKTASCFYIMQCTRSINQDILISVKEIFERLVLVVITALAREYFFFFIKGSVRDGLFQQELLYL